MTGFSESTEQNKINANEVLAEHEDTGHVHYGGGESVCKERQKTIQTTSLELLRIQGSMRVIRL